MNKEQESEANNANSNDSNEKRLKTLQPINDSNAEHIKNEDCEKCKICIRKAQTEKKCTGCQIVKNINMFYFVSSKIKYRKSKCKDCENKHRATLYMKKGKKPAWHEKNPVLFEHIKTIIIENSHPREILDRMPTIKMHMVQYVKKIIKD